MTAKVLPMKPTKPSSLAKISPPEGWRDSDGIGFLGAEGADGQRVPLVLVHDLAAWMLTSKPMKRVTQDICAAIERHGLDGVFYTRTDDFAMAYDTPSEWDAFAGKPDASKIAAQLRAAWLIQPWELDRLVNTPGFPPEYCSESCTPFEYSRHKGNPTASIAVTYDLAHKLWGWGTVGSVGVETTATSSQPAAKPKKVPQSEQVPEWDGQRLAKRRDELKREAQANNEKGYMPKLAEECGLPEREIRRRTSTWEKTKGNPMRVMAETLSPSKKTA